MPLVSSTSSNSITGYSNPLSMKNINDDRLTNIEKFVRGNGAKIVEDKLKGQIDDVTENQIFVNIYGDTYKSLPECFCFRDGDRMLIKELVVHVKGIVDGNGINSGLHKFKMEVTKPRYRRLPKTDSKTVPVTCNEPTNIENSKDLKEMKSLLIDKVETCLLKHGATELVDIANLNEIVHVTTENHRVYGNITCVICQNTNKKKKSKHRIAYCPIKNYWIMSNFVKHLVDYHRLKSIRDNTKQKHVKIETSIDKKKHPKMMTYI